MGYKELLQFVQSIIDAVQNSALFVVKELRQIAEKTFSVRVENPQEKVTVEGKVTVDQSKVEKELQKLYKAVFSLNRELKPLKEVRVSNFPKPPKIPPFPQYPKEIKIANFPKGVNTLPIIDAIKKVEAEVSRLKLDPKIEVKPPSVTVQSPEVVVPKQDPPIVNVEPPDLSDITKIIEFLNGLGAKNPLPVRLSDGKKFYKALEKMAEIYAGSSFSAFQTEGGYDARATVNRRNEIQVTISDTWDVNDIDKVDDTTTYFGEETIGGAWRVRKVTVLGAIKSIRHATIRNNSGISSYESAWDARTTLNYGYARDL